jgi:hypothetical protein
MLHYGCPRRGLFPRKIKILSTYRWFTDDESRDCGRRGICALGTMAWLSRPVAAVTRAVTTAPPASQGAVCRSRCADFH